MGAEFTARHRLMRKPRPFDEVGEEAIGVLRSRRRAEAGAPAGSRVGHERELRHEEKSSADRAQIKVHAPRCVGKNAITEQALKEPVRIAWLIGAPYAHERDHAVLDRPDNA